MEDINKIITDNMGLVYKQLHRFNLAYDEDAYSHALEGLWVAIETFDETKNIAFSTYASTVIYNRIAGYLREISRKSRISVVSFDEIMYEDVTLADCVGGGTEPYKEYIKSEKMNAFWCAFDKVLSSMTNSRARAIIEDWKQSDFKLHQGDLAKRLNTSQANVSRTLSAFKHKLKKEMEDYL